jgi:hypothetical protein
VHVFIVRIMLRLDMTVMDDFYDFAELIGDLPVQRYVALLLC